MNPDALHQLTLVLDKLNFELQTTNHWLQILNLKLDIANDEKAAAQTLPRLDSNDQSGNPANV
jgi:hypothetical protein